MSYKRERTRRDPAAASEHDRRITLGIARIRSACRQGKKAVKALLSTPCNYRPGSVDKIAVMAMRKELGLEVFHEGDLEMQRELPQRPVVMGQGRARMELV